MGKIEFKKPEENVEVEVNVELKIEEDPPPLGINVVDATGVKPEFGKKGA